MESVYIIFVIMGLYAGCCSKPVAKLPLWRLFFKNLVSLLTSHLVKLPFWRYTVFV